MGMKMLSRVAESLFWMSRYLERAEDVARIIAVNFQASLDAPDVSQTLAWEPVIAITGDRQMYAAEFDRYDEASVIAARWERSSCASSTGPGSSKLPLPSFCPATRPPSALGPAPSAGR